MTADWYDPIPFEDFLELNKQAVNGPVPEKVPGPVAVNGTNVVCGPILRLWGTLEEGAETYRASIMLVSEGNKPSIEYTIGPDVRSAEAKDLADGEFPGEMYHETKKGLMFWRFEVELDIEKYEQRVRYRVNGQVNPAHQFFIPASEDSMNVMAYSCNGFSLGTDTTPWQLSLWLDVLRKHANRQHYHVMLGGGDQIYNDALKKDCKTLETWIHKKLSYQKRQVQVTPEIVEDLENYYLKSYLEWFGKGFYDASPPGTLQPLFPLAMAQIPTVSIWDDHDIIDGYGSYKHKTMELSVFVHIGAVAYKYYMLFQHQVSPDEPLHTKDPSWILSKSNGAFIKQKGHSTFMRLGRQISLLGLDCRTERQVHQIVPELTYKEVFKRLESEIANAPETKHLLVMLGVPILYPRLVWIEKILASRVLKPVRGLATRGLFSQGFINDFDGSAELLDDLNDHWCALLHKKERNFLVKSLLDFGAKHAVRITILSGDVHLGCFGRIKTRAHKHPGAHLRAKDKLDAEFNATEYPEHDPRLMFNVTSSAIVNPAPPNPMAALLDTRSIVHKFDKFTEEDVVPIFHINPDGSARDGHKFLNKRNWNDLILAKQSPMYKDKIGTVSKIPSAVLPKDVERASKVTPDDRNVKYPARSESLVTSIHFENDGNDPEATTMAYEVLIPDMCEKYILQKARVKHLHD